MLHNRQGYVLNPISSLVLLKR